MTNDVAATGYWNHNVAYHPLVLSAVPPACGSALDVGCGDGLLARKLASRARRVVGIDCSAAMVDVARRLSLGHPNVDFLHADFLQTDFFQAGSLACDSHAPAAAPYGDQDPRFDFVCSVATVHHMEFGPAVGRMADLLRPGGRLVLIGLARTATPSDLAFSVLGVPVHQAHRLSRRGCGNPHQPPVRDPDMSYGQIRDEARDLLPGARFRRHLLWRYSIVWTKP